MRNKDELRSLRLLSQDIKHHQLVLSGDFADRLRADNVMVLLTSKRTNLIIFM
jgi:hypothetical protein